MLSELASKLKARLSEPLPGIEAQKNMVPRGGNIRRFKIDEAKARRGGVLLLLFEEEGVIKFPLIKRPEYDGIHGGQVSFPGGKYEDGDSDLIQTAIREAHEEVGIIPEDVEVLGCLSDMIVAVSNFIITPVIGISGTRPAFIRQKSEVDYIIEAELNELLDPENLLEKEINIRNGFRINAPYFSIKNEVVWGATSMMLSEFKMIVEEVK